MKEIIKGEIPFVRILIPLLCGITAALLYASRLSLLVATSLGVICFVALAAFLIGYNYFKVYNRRWLAGAVFQSFVFFLAYSATIQQSQKFDELYFAGKEFDALTVKIISEPKLTGDILRFEADVVQGFRGRNFYPTNGKLLIALKADTSKALDFRYGDVLMVPPEYNEIEPPYNPAEFDFKNFLANHAIYFQAFIRQGQIQLIRRDAGNPIISFSYQLRQKLVAKFNRYIHDRDAAAVASTLILGYRADLSREVLDAYSKTGTMHVLSVSGMHVGIVFIVLTFALRFMNRSKPLRLIRALLMIFLIWAYAILTGFCPSVCRAALMLTIVVFGQAINRKSNGYNLVAASAVLLLFYNPYFLVDVGFQLSYLAVLGLIYLYPKIYHLFYIKNKVGDKIWSYASLSFSAQAATFPISMFYFHQFPLYFLLSNIFILIPVALIMYAGLAFILIPVDVVHEWLGFFLEKSIVFTNKGLFYIENLPYANLSGIWISTWFYLLIYVFLFLAAFGLLYKNKRFIYFSAAILAILVVSTSLKRTAQLQQKQVVLFSLRKNTAIGFLDGANASVLTDLSTDNNAFAFSVRPCLESNGYKDSQTFSPGKSFSTGSLFAEGNFLQFRKWKMLLCDSTINYKQFSEPIFVDAVLLRGNPKVNLKELSAWLHFNIAFVDGTNLDYKIHRWQTEASVLGCKLYVLKKNAAYIANLE